MAFEPSVEAAAAAVPGENIVTRPHPGGAEGVRISLAEVADRIFRGRKDPRLEGWAGRMLIAAGKPRTNRAQAQALLDALRAKTMYKPDPLGVERIAQPHVTLCLDDKGICMPAGDCDDLVVAFGSAAISCGIPTRVVGQAFDTAYATHVISEILDTEDGWLAVDPSSDFPVGKCFPATREWRVDPMARSSGIPAMGGTNAGDFVGVGQIPTGAAATASTLTGAGMDAVTTQLEAAVFRVKQARNDLGAALHQITNTALLANPTQPFDPEPSTPIASVADFPGNGTWTQSMDAISSQLYDILDRLAQYGDQALGGMREVFVDPSTSSAYIQALPTDDWSLHAVVTTATEVVFGFFDATGKLLSGFGSKSGAAYSASQVQSFVAQNPTSSTGTTGVQGIQVVVGILAGAAIAIGVCWVLGKMADSATAQAEEATNQKIVASALSATDKQALLSTVGKNRTALASAQNDNNQSNPFVKTSANVADALKWIAIGGIGTALVVALAPVLSEFAQRGARKA